MTEVSLPVGSEDLNISGPIFKTGNNIDSKIVVDPMVSLLLFPSCWKFALDVMTLN